MIKGFKCKDTEALFNGRFVKRFSSIEQQAFKRLIYLDDAENLEELGRLPGNRLEGLKGDRKGQCSIRITCNGAFAFAGMETVRMR